MIKKIAVATLIVAGTAERSAEAGLGSILLYGSIATGGAICYYRASVNNYLMQDTLTRLLSKDNHNHKQQEWVAKKITSPWVTWVWSKNTCYVGAILGGIVGGSGLLREIFRGFNKVSNYQ